jgi:ABC-type glutathione transport system ATPase component
MAKKPSKTETLLRNSDKSLPLLDVQDLTVEFVTRRGIVRAVQRINISVAKGESLAIVGESGSGKSVTSYAVMRILDRAGRIADGTVMFSGVAGKRDARIARPRNVDDFSIATFGAQSDPQDRSPDRRCAAPARASG